MADGLAAPGSDDAVAAGQGAAELETVMVYARRLLPASRVAATVSVITQETIERTLVADVKQLVRYVPGLSVRSDPFRFGVDTIAIRGIGGNRVAVEVDGVPAAGGFAVGNFADSGRAFVDPVFLRRVEVLRGPASSLYGSDAIGGVVSMTTITAQSLLAAGRDDGWSVASGYAGVDSGWHGAVLGGARRADTTALLGYVHRQGNEPGTAADVEPNPRDYRSDSMLAKVEFGAMPGGPLTLAAELSRVQQETSVNAWLGLVGTRFANTTALEGDDLQQRQSHERQPASDLRTGRSIPPTGSSTCRRPTRTRTRVRNARPCHRGPRRWPSNATSAWRTARLASISLRSAPSTAAASATHWSTASKRPTAASRNGATASRPTWTPVPSRT